VLHVATGKEWAQELVVAVKPRVHQLTATATLDLLKALTKWTTGSSSSSSSLSVAVEEHEAGQQQQERWQLLHDMLQQVARQPHRYSPQSLCYILVTVADLGLTAATANTSQAAVHKILDELTAEHHMASLTTGQMLTMLTALTGQRLAVAPQEAFMTALQWELRSRLQQLQPSQFLVLAEAVAGFGYTLEKEVLEGYLTTLEPMLPDFTGEDRALHGIMGMSFILILFYIVTSTLAA
jgi:hypothetical protein